MAPGPEGEFLRKAGMHKQWVTSSGYMNAVSAGGKHLQPLHGRDWVAEALKEFKALPKAERKPGAIKVPDLKPSEMLLPGPPTGGLVLRVHGRYLARDRGELRAAKLIREEFPHFPYYDSPQTLGLWKSYMQPNTECMWLLENEWKSLVPANPVVGQKLEVAPVICERLARFHVNATRLISSGGTGLSRKHIKSSRLTLVVDEVLVDRIRLSLDGFIHIGSKFDADKAKSAKGPLPFGQEMSLRGVLEYDREKKVFTRFDAVALGDFWGRASLGYLFQPGRRPVGFALELATGNSPTDRLLPGGGGIQSDLLDGHGYFPRPYFNRVRK